jgi:NAD(P)-dependent dehydrogenase (short-subunit alcohol dehydrogenase family)
MAGLLEGKSALITGGGGGIGRATALAFAREGARVAIADAIAETAQQTVALVNQAGGQAMSLTVEVTDGAQVQAMVRAVVSAYGRLDCAFNNAGIAGFQVDAAGKKTHEWADDSFDRMIAVNLKGVWLCMKHEIPQMLTQGGGVIVNTGSIAGLIAKDNIRVNAVCPGYIETKMTEDTMRRRGEELMAMVPFHRMGKPEEIAEMVVWLSSERASYVSGACYNVDGGYMAT